MEQVLKFVTMCTLISLLGACTTTKDAVIPNDGPTMLEIYNEHMKNIGSDIPARHRLEIDAPVREPLGAHFQRLPNPDLTMYVPPHFAEGGKIPVPGYTTIFPMYEGVEYALPGEVTDTISNANF